MEKEKIAQAIQILKEEKIDCWMVADMESELISDPIMDYVVGTGVVWLSFFLFFANGEKQAIVGNLDIEKMQQTGLFDRVWAYKGSPRDSLLEILHRLDPKKIAIDYSLDNPAADGLTYGKYLKIAELLKETPFSARLVSAESIIGKLRGRKSSGELKLIRAAIEHTVAILDQVTSRARPGMTEKEVAEIISHERNRLGLKSSWGEDSCPSVFTGPQTVGAHIGPSGKVLARGQVFNIDFGVQVERYCSDLQRTWYILKEQEKQAPAEVRRGFDTVLQSIQMAAAALKPGVAGVAIDKIARDYIVSQGYDEYPHALGHQVGRFAHDGGGLLAPAWERYGQLPFIPVEKDQVYTIEPRIYIKDYGVATVEEMVLVGESGVEFLSPPQRQLFLIK